MTSLIKEITFDEIIHNCKCFIKVIEREIIMVNIEQEVERQIKSLRGDVVEGIKGFDIKLSRIKTELMELRKELDKINTKLKNSNGKGKDKDKKNEAI